MGEIDERYKSNNQEDANEFISNFLSELLEETKSCRNYEIPTYLILIILLAVLGQI